MVESSSVPGFNSDHLDRFRELARRECELLAQEGIRLLAYESEDLPHFSKLTWDRQKLVLRQLAEQVSIYEEMSAESFSLRDNPQLVWRSMSRSGLTPPGDLFDKIRNEDVIVIFSSDQKQLFRNLEFLRHSILTLEELYATEWYRYTKRDPLVVQKLRNLAGDILSGKLTGTFNPQIEEHLIEQTGSQGNSKLWLQIDYVAPITMNGKVSGVIVIERVWKADS